MLFITFCKWQTVKVVCIGYPIPLGGAKSNVFLFTYISFKPIYIFLKSLDNSWEFIIYISGSGCVSQDVQTQLRKSKQFLLLNCRHAAASCIVCARGACSIFVQHVVPGHDPVQNCHSGYRRQVKGHLVQSKLKFAHETLATWMNSVWTVCSGSTTHCWMNVVFHSPQSIVLNNSI